MTLTTLAWLCMAAYAIHILEEFMLNWRDWACGVLRLPVTWPDFYVTNAVVVVLSIVQAMLAEALPVVPLGFAALMLINAVLFHVAPVIVTRRFSPGLITAVALFLPLGLMAFGAALRNGSVGLGGCLAAFAIGAVLMAFPIILLRLKARPAFQQPPTVASM